MVEDTKRNNRYNREVLNPSSSRPTLNVAVARCVGDHDAQRDVKRDQFLG